MCHVCAIFFCFVTVLEEDRLGDQSVFLDAGSGYGKVLFHVKMQVNPRYCIGVECVQPRAHTANNLSIHLHSKQLLPDIQGIITVHSDIADHQNLRLFQQATHIYSFDVCLAQHTKQKMAEILRFHCPNVKLFVSFTKRREWLSYGLQLELIKQIPGCTTSVAKQSFTCRIYRIRNEHNSLIPLPALSSSPSVNESQQLSSDL